MGMRRISGGVLTGRWEPEDKRLRPEMKTPNQEDLMVMVNEMSMMGMKMKMRVLRILLMMALMMMYRMREETESEPEIKREIKEREKIG